ncbi:MAG: hypothetical protein ACJ8DC_01445 [Gemmatimonadales bacterium]
MGREEGSARQGDRIVLPAGVSHVHPWSVSAEELHVRQTSQVDRPDSAGLLASLQALVTLFGLATAGKVNDTSSAGWPGWAKPSGIAPRIPPMAC